MQPQGGDRTVRKGPWTMEEDEVLLQHVREHGPREWSSIRSKGLLPRTGKSCRLRWVNKLRPNLKTGCKFSPEEERVVIDLQAQFGNKWAKISTYLPGRTDNDVKNFWSTRQKRLARILRGPLPGRRSSKNTCNSTEPSSHDLPTPKDVYMDLIPFQQMHSTGQCSQEPCLENNCATAPFPGPPDFIDALPPSFEFSVDAAECCSSSTVLMTQPSFNDTAGPVSDVDALGFANVGSLDDLAYLEPLAQVQHPPQFFGLDQDMSEVFFDDLPSEMFDFFEPPAPPPPPPMPSPPSKQL